MEGRLDLWRLSRGRARSKPKAQFILHVISSLRNKWDVLRLDLSFSSLWAAVLFLSLMGIYAFEFNFWLSQCLISLEVIWEATCTNNCVPNVKIHISRMSAPLFRWCKRQFKVNHRWVHISLVLFRWHHTWLVISKGHHFKIEINWYFNDQLHI